MNQPRLRVAIIGTGMIGRAHTRAARDAGASVIGVLGSSSARSADAAAEWDLPTGFPDFDALIAAAPDVVHICTPNDTHVGYGVAAAQAGLNIVVEKPIATNPADAQTIADAVRSAGVVATVPFVYRYHPLVRELRARRRAGEFGDVLLVHGSYLQDWLVNPNSTTWRVDPTRGGASRAFADIGSHWVDLAEFVSGERVTDATASMTIAYPTRPATGGDSFGAATEGGPRVAMQTEDTAVATFRTERCIVANTVISQVSAGRKNRLWLEVDGTRGSAVFDQEQPESVWLGREDATVLLRRGEGTVSADQGRLNKTPAGHPQGWPDALSAFCADTYAAVRGEQPEGLPTVIDGLRSVNVVDAVLRAAVTGERTDIAVDHDSEGKR